MWIHCAALHTSYFDRLGCRLEDTRRRIIELIQFHEEGDLLIYLLGKMWWEFDVVDCDSVFGLRLPKNIEAQLAWSYLSVLHLCTSQGINSSIEFYLIRSLLCDLIVVVELSGLI